MDNVNHDFEIEKYYKPENFEDIIYCPNCDDEIDEMFVYCPTCGYEIRKTIDESN